MIQIGHTDTNGADVVYETVTGAVNANASIQRLKASKSGDNTIDCFYMAIQINNTDWDKYGFIDQT